MVMPMPAMALPHITVSNTTLILALQLASCSSDSEAYFGLDQGHQMMYYIIFNRVQNCYHTFVISMVVGWNDMEMISDFIYA
jgi:hypothetical protein